MLSFALLALLVAVAAAKRLAGGGTHFLVLQRDGQVFAVGRNNYGQLGLDMNTNVAFPQPVLSVVNATDVSAGDLHSCVLDEASQVKCAGLNLDRQLGDGTTTSRRVLVSVIGLASGIGEVQCGFSGSCARTTASGGVQCWGQVANAVRTSPVTISLSGGVQSAALGYDHACFVATVGGKLYCMGNNANGQLGTGNTNPQTAPTPVVGLAAENIVSVACGERHTCAVNANGAMFCWGQVTNGRLGNPGVASDSPVPVQVVGIAHGAASAWTGRFNSFALMQNGTVLAFGADFYGVFGTGSTGAKAAPIVFGQGVSGVVEVRGGDRTTCVLFPSDAVGCTGSNLFGQLGGSEMAHSYTLVEMQLPAPPTAAHTNSPTAAPTKRPTKVPSLAPTKRPTKAPTKRPTKKATLAPTKRPTKVPTAKPTKRPTKTPTKRPTKTPTAKPTKKPTKTPTKRPTTKAPTKRPTTAKPVNL